MNRRAIRGLAVPAAVVVGLLGSGMLVWQTSDAAFNSVVTTPANTFASGKVTLSSTSTGSALFTVANLVPSSTGVACVDVSYSGTVPSSIKFYAGYSGSTALAPYLTFQVDQIANGASCVAGTAVVANLYGGAPAQTLSGLVTAASGYSSGLGTWTPSSASTQRYRLQYTLQDNNSAQNLSTQVDMTWEARNT